MRLLSRHDASLAVALVVAAFVLFQKSLGLAIDGGRHGEQRFDVDLMAGLIVLAGAFAFHQHRKRQAATAAAAVAAAEARHERRRSAELERLVALGGALSAALDVQAVQQVFWRYLPAFARDRDLWMLRRTAAGWEHVIQNAVDAEPSRPALEAIAAEALTAPARADAQADGMVVTDTVCFPMVVGDASLGVVGVRNAPALSLSERHALGTAVALVAISLRNVELLTSTRENSLRDPLTQCFNRAYAAEALATEMQRARRNAKPVSLLMFDVDCLKDVNDRHGHLAGDAVLTAVAAQMAATLRASDVKCRWGGDEFLVVLPDTPLAGAARAGDALTREVSQLRVPAPTGTVAPTISVGVAAAGPDDIDALAFIARVDAALYAAKHDGRNRFAVATSLREAS